MSTVLFRIEEHKVEAAHIRAHPRATSTNEEEVLYMAVKQYTPLENANPQPGDVTIIAAHANSFPKELYEPLWDELQKRCQSFGFGIRSIWIADVVHQGYSGVINEGKLGNDPSFTDHSRDLLHMINVFRKQMPRPIVGVGHSMGGCQLVNLALLHPRLFETLVLYDPVIASKINIIGNIGPAFASAKRRDKWPTRDEAAKAFKSRPFYQTWDPRVLDRWIQHGLRDAPTTLYPNSQSPEVTLTTTVHQEVMTFIRGNFRALPGDEEPSSAEFTIDNPKVNRRTHPDLTPSDIPQSPFYRGESILVFRQLPHVRPSVLYVFGEKSNLTEDPATVEEKLATTGSGVGGSGGRVEGRVDSVMLKDTGHLIPMEKVEESADYAAKWIGKEMTRYRDWEKKTQEEWGGMKGPERSIMPERFKTELNSFMDEFKKTQKKGGSKL